MSQHVITVAQQKGGAGKTTILTHCAVALAQRGYRVALIDTDPQGSLSHWHSIREQRMGEGYTGMRFSTLSGWRVGSEVSRLKKNHDIILIDSPPQVETEARSAIRVADLVLIPVQPSPTDLWATKATVEFADKEKIPVRTILNRVNAKSKIVSKIRGELTDLAESTLGNRVAFASAIMDGKGVTEVDPKSAASQEIKLLVEEILNIAGLDSSDEAA